MNELGLACLGAQISFDKEPWLRSQHLGEIKIRRPGPCCKSVPSGGSASNRQHPVWKTGALPIELPPLATLLKMVLPGGNDPPSPPYQDGVLPLYYGSHHSKFSLIHLQNSESVIVFSCMIFSGLGRRAGIASSTTAITKVGCGIALGS